MFLRLYIPTYSCNLAHTYSVICFCVIITLLWRYIAFFTATRFELNCIIKYLYILLWFYVITIEIILNFFCIFSYFIVPPSKVVGLWTKYLVLYFSLYWREALRFLAKVDSQGFIDILKCCEENLIIVTPDIVSYIYLMSSSVMSGCSRMVQM